MRRFVDRDDGDQPGGRGGRQPAFRIFDRQAPRRREPEPAEHQFVHVGRGLLARRFVTTGQGIEPAQAVLAQRLLQQRGHVVPRGRAGDSQSQPGITGFPQQAAHSGAQWNRPGLNQTYVVAGLQRMQIPNEGFGVGRQAGPGPAGFDKVPDALLAAVDSQQPCVGGLVPVPVQPGVRKSAIECDAVTVLLVVGQGPVDVENQCLQFIGHDQPQLGRSSNGPFPYGGGAGISATAL